MKPEDLLLQAMLALPERVEKLEDALRTHQWLLMLLLSRSGLSNEKILEAFEIAEKSAKETAQEVWQKKIDEWAKTPEGIETRRKSRRAWIARQKEIWKEECLEDGCIHPDPTADMDRDQE